jgi:hypothetical protein
MAGWLWMAEERSYGRGKCRWDIPIMSGDVPSTRRDIPIMSGDVPSTCRDIPNLRWDIPDEDLVMSQGAGSS